MNEQESTQEEAIVDSPVDQVTVESLAKTIESMQEQIKGLLEQDKGEDVEVELSESDVALNEAKGRIEALEMQRDKAVFSYLVPDGATIEMSEELKSVLFDAYRKNPEGWNAGLGKSVVVEKKGRNLSEGQASWLTNIGSSDTPQPKEGTDADLQVAALKEANGDYVKAAEIYRLNKYGRG